MRKQSQDDQVMLDTPNGTNLKSKIDKMSIKSQKMYEKIDQIILKAIQAIDESQQEIMKAENDFNSALLNLHVKMTEIKPLRSIKTEYNDFYKKLSGLGKGIQEISYDAQPKIQTPQLFDQKDIKSIEESLSDHYLTQKNYQAANAILMENQKKRLFEECFQLKQDILSQSFVKAVEWVEKINLSADEEALVYELHKMKIAKLVKQNKGEQAIAYVRKNLANFTVQHGQEISKLLSFVLTQTSCLWGKEIEYKYKKEFQNRYTMFLRGSLEDLANRFVNVYLNKTKIYLENPVAKCHQVGLKFRKQFLDHLKYLPSGQQQLPKILPFSIKTGPDAKYHSQFFCPITKQIHGPLDKNIVLSCGHMISNAAITKMIQGRDTRRKMKCPICQSDQILQHNMKVQF